MQAKEGLALINGTQVSTALALHGLFMAERLLEAAERDLALTLDAFDAATADAYDKRSPNLIAEHAYRLAQSFSKFYAACPVLAAPVAVVRVPRHRVPAPRRPA